MLVKLVKIISESVESKALSLLPIVSQIISLITLAFFFKSASVVSSYRGADKSLARPGR